MQALCLTTGYFASDVKLSSCPQAPCAVETTFRLDDFLVFPKNTDHKRDRVQCTGSKLARYVFLAPLVQYTCSFPPCPATETKDHLTGRSFLPLLFCSSVHTCVQCTATRWLTVHCALCWCRDTILCTSGAVHRVKQHVGHPCFHMYPTSFKSRCYEEAFSILICKQKASPFRTMPI